MMRYLMALFCVFGGMSLAQAETIRGGLDCEIQAQSYLIIDGVHISQSDGRPKGDPTGSTLRLRYEIDRATPSLPFRFKLEFSRFDIYFDTTFRPNALETTKEGWLARHKNGTLAASFTPHNIQLKTDGRHLYLEKQNEEIWTGAYEAAQQAQGRHIRHHMGLACTHPTDAIAKITAELQN